MKIVRLEKGQPLKVACLFHLLSYILIMNITYNWPYLLYFES